MEGLGQGEGVCFLISGFAVGLGSCCAYIDCQAVEQVVALLEGLILKGDSGMGLCLGYLALLLVWGLGL